MFSGYYMNKLRVLFNNEKIILNIKKSRLLMNGMLIIVLILVQFGTRILRIFLSLQQV